MNSKQSTIEIRGMTCGACVRHVEGALRAVAGVDDVRVNLETGSATVEHLAFAPSPAELVAAITDAGYEARVEPS